MQQRMMSVERLEALVRRGIAEGWMRPAAFRDGTPRRMFISSLELDCEAPRQVELWSRDSARHGLPVFPLTVIMRVRCRKCEWCKKMRQRFWTGRAMAEYEASPRTWMATFTCRLDEHYKIDSSARVRLHSHGVEFDELPEVEQFEARCVELGAHITLWLKRMRKAGAQFRYLMIAEAHKGDTNQEMRYRPHVHMLLHERSWGSVWPYENKWVQKEGKWHEYMPDTAFPREQWPLGFTRFEVANDARTAVYLCKYLTKSAMVRVRPSQRYGSPQDGDYIAKLDNEAGERSVPSVP